MDGADLDVAEGEIIGLIGPNGAGKSTFFNCLAGDAEPTEGTIRFLDHDVTRATPEEHARLGMARTFQVPVTFEDMSVAENVMVGAFLRHSHRAAARRADGGGAGLHRPGTAGGHAAPVHWARPAASGWRSPARSPPNLAFCCWTRRWPG